MAESSKYLVTIPEDRSDQLKAAATEKGVNPSTLIRIIACQWLKDHETIYAVK